MRGCIATAINMGRHLRQVHKLYEKEVTRQLQVLRASNFRFNPDGTKCPICKKKWMTKHALYMHLKSIRKEWIKDVKRQGQSSSSSWSSDSSSQSSSDSSDFSEHEEEEVQRPPRRLPSATIVRAPIDAATSPMSSDTRRGFESTLVPRVIIDREKHGELHRFTGEFEPEDFEAFSSDSVELRGTRCLSHHKVFFRNDERSTERNMPSIVAQLNFDL